MEEGGGEKEDLCVCSFYICSSFYISYFLLVVISHSHLTSFPKMNATASAGRLAGGDRKPVSPADSNTKGRKKYKKYFFETAVA